MMIGYYIWVIVFSIIGGFSSTVFCITKESALQVIQVLENKKPHNYFLCDEQTVATIEDFLENVFLHYVSCDPELLSKLGLFESMGIHEHNAHLTDISPDVLKQNLQEKKKILGRLNQFDIETCSQHQKISHAILSWSLNHEIAGEDFLFYEYKINQLFGVLSELSVLFTQNHTLKNARDVQYYITRLAKVSDKISQAIAILALQKSKGLLPPRFVLERIIKNINTFLTEEKSEHIFYGHLKRSIHTLNLEDKDIFLSQAYCTLEKSVYPAYEKLKNVCADLLEHVVTNHGVWALPRGDEYYAYMLKYHTTTDLTPEQIHQLGLYETASIQNGMRKILAELGIIGDDKNIGVLMQTLSHNPELYYPNTDQGREQCLVDYNTILDRSRKELSHLFDLKPSVGVKIERVPLHEQDTMPGAYYHEPSLDGSRPGIFFANLRDMAEVPKYHMETLTIHESEPGHHFQLALQQANDTPLIRKLASYTAYIEGWALYVEKLAYEHDFYSSPYARLGHLQDELLRAVRLVVDTGIHYKRWSREQAIMYMQQELGYHYNSAVTEVERYFVLPGQACAYKLGQLEFLGLRAYAQERLGNHFDIRKFHNVILKLGAVPLMIVEQAIEHYVQETLETIT